MNWLRYMRPVVGFQQRHERSHGTRHVVVDATKPFSTPGKFD
jgi:hypothetical protein